MKTYQDFQKIGDSEKELIDFVWAAIVDHKASDLYKNAEIAYDYDKHQNRTIMDFKKLLYTVSGSAVPDNYSANWKMASNFFNEFTTQENQYLLGNGVTWQKSETKKKLGDDFDAKLQDLGHNALVGGVAFGFYNLDHLQGFNVLEFVPIPDEENGALMLGIRFWQIDRKKPLRATLYELDGYTEFIWKEGKGEILKEKRAYIIKTVTSEADGTEIYAFENYPGFPIVPLWGNKKHQSELIGRREQIDCYDLIKSGFANDIDDASLIYWTIQNNGGMDDVDLAKFIERIKTVHAATVDSDAGTTVESHSVDVPYAGREALLDRIRSDLYEDFMALDTKNLADGAVTATQIKAAYEPLNSKADDFEYCVLEFLKDILKLAGIENDKATFTRSAIINKQEELQILTAVSPFLSPEYVTKKILTLLGDADAIDEVLNAVESNELERFGTIQNDPTSQENTSDE